MYKKTTVTTAFYAVSRQLNAMREVKRGKGLVYKSSIISKSLVLSDINDLSEVLFFTLTALK